MIPRILIGLGIYALAWAVLVPMRWPEYPGLTLVFVTIPYGTIGLLGFLGGWLWRRGSRAGGHLAVAWVIVTGAWVSFELASNWWPRLMAIGDPNVWYNWALPEIWVPVPLAIGLLLVLLMGAARLARRSSQRPAANG